MAKGLRSPMLFLCLLLSSSFNELQTFSTHNHMVTLTDKARSFVEYESFNTSRYSQLSFKFKTYCLHCLLLYVGNAKAATENKNYILLMLLKGRLNVHVYKDGSVKTSQLFSRDLNNLQWHHIDIKIFDTKSSIRVDNESRTLADDSIALSSLLYFGGVENTATISTAAYSRNIHYKQSFVGCISTVMFKIRNGEKAAAREIRRVEASTGCLNACTQNPCKNQGICVNRFTETACDCVGTGYEGENCNGVTSDAVFLNGTDYISARLDSENEAPFKLKMRFRTRHAEGLLLVTNKQGNGLYVEVADGSIKFTINKRGFFFGGGKLHDTQWHFLVVLVSNSMIFVELDRTFNQTIIIAKRSDVVAPPVYIGGLPDDAAKPSSISDNFRGCLQQIYVNDFDIISKITVGKDRRISSSKTIENKCKMKFESREEASRRINAEKARKTTASPTATALSIEERRTSSEGIKEPTHKASKKGRSDSHSKLAAENNKDLIAWISSGVVSGTIVLMIITACAIHYFKYKYENIFVSRVNEQDYIGDQQQGVNNIPMLPKQQAVVFLPDKQMSKVVNL